MGSLLGSKEGVSFNKRYLVKPKVAEFYWDYSRRQWEF